MIAYKVLKDTLLLMWDVRWADEYVAQFNAHHFAQGVFGKPIGHMARVGQEITVEHGARRPLLQAVGEKEYTLYAVDMTITVNKAVYTGITLAYDEWVPSVVLDSSTVRALKKRNK